MRILLYDLECSPNTVYTWAGSLFEQNVIDVKKNWELLSIAYKWLGEDKVTCISRQNQKTDKQLTKKFWKLMNEADIVIAHNGIKFDNKKMMAKFIEHGLGPPSPFKTIDTLQAARQRFSFNSNKLDELGKLLGVGRKIKITEGFELWLQVMADDPAAWKKMIAYNIQDVELLEKVYLKLRPYMDKHTNVGITEDCACPKCGSLKLQSRGYNITAGGKFIRYQCRSCGGWSQSKRSIEKPVSNVKNIG